MKVNPTWPLLQPGQFLLSVEFNAPAGSEDIVLTGPIYDDQASAKLAVERLWTYLHSVKTIALIGRKFSGQVGVLDVYTNGQWDSEAEAEMWETVGPEEDD
jgi:hypothetical protein